MTSTRTPPQVPQPPSASAQVEGGSDRSARHDAKPARQVSGLQPHELCTPSTHAVEQDFAPCLERLKKFPARHRAELAQWARASDGVSPTLGALLALLRHLEGLGRSHKARGDRRRLYGLGVQLPLRFLAAVLGRNKATVCDAITEGMERGLLLRHAYTRKVRLITKGRAAGQRLETVRTKDGEHRDTVNVHGVLYITPAGCSWLDKRGTTEADLSKRNPRQRGRGRVLTGLLWDLLQVMRQVRRAIAARLSRPPTNTTPEEEAKPKNLSSVVVPPVGNGPEPPDQAVRPVGADFQKPSSGTNDAPNVGRGGAALPTKVRALADALRIITAEGRRHAGLSGKGSHSGEGAETPPEPRQGYGPPLCPSRYLDRETERCWQRHVIVEGGAPRPVLVKVLGIGGQWLGDYRTELHTGRVKVWSPALTAGEAYPGEWSSARGMPVVRAQLEADFAMYLGPRLRRRFVALTARVRAGERLRCPVEGCRCQG